MRKKRDDWEKHRHNGQHFSDQELQVIRDGYTANKSVSAIAFELKASSRSVYTQFFKLQVSGAVKRRRAQATLPSRFYSSSFELEG